jgi:hypothetical protein
MRRGDADIWGRWRRNRQDRDVSDRITTCYSAPGKALHNYGVGGWTQIPALVVPELFFPMSAL